MGHGLRFWQNLFPKEQIPYYCRHLISGSFAFPENFRKADYVGLLFTHLTVLADTTVLIAYWKGAEPYQAQATLFEKALGLPAAAEAGFSTCLQADKPAWWQPNSLREALLVVTAVSAALFTLYGQLESLFALPAAQHLYAKREAEDVLEGTPLSILFSVHSSVASVAQTLQLEPPQIYDGNAVVHQLEYDTPATVSLPAGQQRSIQIKGIAPAYAKHSDGAPKAYEIRMPAVVRAGLLTRPFFGHSLVIEPKTIRVWRQTSSIAPFSRRRVQGLYCEVKSTVYSAQKLPEENRFELILTVNPGTVKQLSLSAAGLTEVVSVKSNDETAFRTRFAMRPATNFSQSEIRATITTAAVISQSDCDAFAQQIRVSRIF